MDRLWCILVLLGNLEKYFFFQGSRVKWSIWKNFETCDENLCQILCHMPQRGNRVTVVYLHIAQAWIEFVWWEYNKQGYFFTYSSIYLWITMLKVMSHKLIDVEAHERSKSKQPSHVSYQQRGVNCVPFYKCGVIAPSWYFSHLIKCVQLWSMLSLFLSNLIWMMPFHLDV